MNRSKQKGTAGETAIVAYLNAHGYPGAERRTLQGAFDKGDIAGIPGVVVEAKKCNRMELGQWVDEAEVEAANAGVPVGVVWHWRRGKSSAGEWYVTMSGHTFLELIA